jgi:phosphoserine phosphatase RsbU/P
VFVGLAACAIAAMHRRSATRIFIWLGNWSALYGASHLTRSPAIVAALPRSFQAAAPYANTAMTYLVVVVGLLSFRELSMGNLRILLQVLAYVGSAIAIAAIAFFAVTGSADKVFPFNNVLGAGGLVLLTTIIAVPKLSSKYLSLPNRNVLVLGTLVFTTEALYGSFARQLGFRTSLLVDHLGFAILLFSFGYVALQLVFANERRLLSVESELATAREIQMSILPSGVPQVDNLAISAAYRPMTSVAGDFYEFIAADQKHLGILVADVSGHGVPAALIASMIKVAAQSVTACAHDPGAVLSGLNHILSGQLRGQFVSAAYMWLDAENQMALYSAAGHPPLLRWREGTLQRIESNGLLFGVLPDCGDYPVCKIPISAGDRFMLYTDGVTEAENGDGDPFGDVRLKEVARDNESRTASEFSDELLSSIAQWKPACITQQDDITLIVIDVL